MAGSVNKVTLLGNLGRDPDVRNTQSGMKVVSLRIATSESWTDKASGERQERTEWHSVVIMNDHLADVAERYLRKGSKVYVEGKLQTRKWTDQQGVDRYTTEVMLGRLNASLVLLGDRQSDGERQERPASSGGSGGRAPASAGAGGGWSGGDGMSGRADSSQYRSGGDLDDEIPF